MCELHLFLECFVVVVVFCSLAGRRPCHWKCPCWQYRDASSSAKTVCYLLRLQQISQEWWWDSSSTLAQKLGKELRWDIYMFPREEPTGSLASPIIPSKGFKHLVDLPEGCKVNQTHRNKAWGKSIKECGKYTSSRQFWQCVWIIRSWIHGLLRFDTFPLSALLYFA